MKHGSRLNKRHVKADKENGPTMIDWCINRMIQLRILMAKYQLNDYDNSDMNNKFTKQKLR
jgi:hypothetical protein